MTEHKLAVIAISILRIGCASTFATGMTDADARRRLYLVFATLQQDGRKDQ